MIRLFISVELPDGIKDRLAELISELKRSGAGIKWVKPQNLHLTLKFLGWVEDSQVDEIIELSAKSVAGAGSFKARFEGLGTFPGGKAPRVIWVGTAEGGGALCKLAKDLEKNMSEAGFRKEERAFKPHLTIGRVKERKGLAKLTKQIGGIKDAGFGEVLVDRINVMKSTLAPNGPVYENLKEVKLS